MFQTIKCPTCGTPIQTKVWLEYCPVHGCKAYLGDKFYLAGDNTGIQNIPPADAT